MRSAPHLIAVLVLSLGSLSSPMQSEQQKPFVTASESRLHVDTHRGAKVMVTNQTGSPEQQPGIDDAVQWSLNRYQITGLDLPELRITFHRDRSNCGGFAGLHSGGSGNHQIDICVGGNLKRRKALLHEMAHVWVSDHLDDSDRRSFLELRGLGSWNDSSVAWEKRGTEQAAMVITWALGDGCVVPDDLVGDQVSTLLSAFEHLTGSTPVCGLVSA